MGYVRSSKNKEDIAWKEFIGSQSTRLVIKYDQRYAAGILIDDWMGRLLHARSHPPEFSDTRETPLISSGSVVNFSTSYQKFVEVYYLSIEINDVFSASSNAGIWMFTFKRLTHDMLLNSNKI